MNPLIHLRQATAILLVALICFGLSTAVRAVDPAPDGGYPHENTAEGTDALLNSKSTPRSVATQRLVLKPYGMTRPGLGTRPSVIVRFTTIRMVISTQRSGLLLLPKTKQATRTRPLAGVRSPRTPVIAILPPVLAHSIITTEVAATRLSVTLRSKAT